ncbi:unnamed protein product [Caenorhabditis auriculariae]|uniref:Autophagy-related protein 11 C-terminal domain-containing protein n=1 Tax=Caenorhabditis auriculariae TaxID=2777116 RepID=A0A8S1H291_9PELO|nr:unnamed protein product [Caenorhabditis auriculariae]
METYCIFDVTKGISLQISLNINTTTVAKLNGILDAETGLRASDQILLTSKGVAFDPDKKLDFYTGTGTQSNPAFLYQKTPRERDRNESSNDLNYILHRIDDAVVQATNCLNKTELAHIYIELPEAGRYCANQATQAIQACMRFVREHQFLCSGWNALIANMDDSVGRLQKLGVRYKAHVDQIPEMNRKAATLLDNFEDVVDQLIKIELPPELLSNLRRSSKDSPPISTLYDWISQADPANTVEDLVSQVRDLFGKFSEIKPQNAIDVMNQVVNQSKNSEFRDVKGINKRINQLEFNVQNNERHMNNIKKNVNRICETPRSMDANNLRNILDRDKSCMVDVLDSIKEIRQTTVLFHRSKQELLQNIRSRLAGFIVTSYDKLHYAHLEMLVFQEKCNGLRLRLELIEQIKEAPAVYARSVAEVIRRLTFKKELTSWHTEHSEKSTNLSNEETELRKRYSRKLEKHFIRALFPGMFDETPAFYVKNLGAFDENLPQVTNDHLHELRQALPSFDELMKVTTPQVYSKLAVKDPQAQGTLRREESFFTKDPVQMHNLNSIHKEFAAANWFGEEGAYGSPGPALLMTRSPHSYSGSESSMKTMPIASSLHNLERMGEEDNGDDEHLSCSVAKSAPIDIPPGPSPRACSSGKSSQFSTPDDSFGNNHLEEGQFAVDDVTRSQSFEFLKPLKLDVLTISKGLLDIRADIVNSNDKFREEFDQISKFLSEELPKEIKIINKAHEEKLLLKMNEIEDLQKELKESDGKLAEANAEVSQIKDEMAANEKISEEKIEELNAKVTGLENDIKTVKADTFKQLTIEYELVTDRNRGEYEAIIDSRDKEIQGLNYDLEKKNQEIKRLRADPLSEEYRKCIGADIRAELEREFKARIEMITKGVEQKKDEAIMRNKKEMEFETRLLQTEIDNLKQSVAMLTEERQLLRDEIQKSVENGGELIDEISEKINGADVTIYRPTKKVAIHTQTDFFEANMPRILSSPMLTSSAFVHRLLGDMKESVYTMDTSCMISSVTPALKEKEKDDSVVRSTTLSDEQGNILSSTCSTQTRIGMQSMTNMVSMQEITEGSTVLVVWDGRHNAYILLCLSSFPHFVKESSVRGLNLLNTDSNTPRRNWVLGCAKKLDMCVIRKAVNRYGLPVGTKVFRVAVDPVSMDSRPESAASKEPILFSDA